MIQQLRQEMAEAADEIEVMHAEKAVLVDDVARMQADFEELEAKVGLCGIDRHPYRSRASRPFLHL